jgi:tRNA(Arg) A34 adenosine deaminase TadA
MSRDDQALLRKVIALSATSRVQGHHPFAAMVVDADGSVLAESFNASADDCTGHAEVNAVRTAWKARPAHGLKNATLYSSAIYWSGISRVVYALSEEHLLTLTGNHPENPTLSLPCREVFARGQRTVQVLGPMLEDEAAKAHEGFWN